MSRQTDLPKIPTVIAARPGVIREALQAALVLLPRLEVAGVAGGGLSTLHLVHKQQPALVIIDSGLPEDEILALLRQVKQDLPHVRCLVVAETHRQQQTLLASGADAVMLRSEPTEGLVEALDKIGPW